MDPARFNDRPGAAFTMNVVFWGAIASLIIPPLPGMYVLGTILRIILYFMGH